MTTTSTPEKGDRVRVTVETTVQHWQEDNGEDVPLRFLEYGDPRFLLTLELPAADDDGETRVSVEVLGEAGS